VQFQFRLEIARVFVLSELERVLIVSQFRLEAYMWPWNAGLSCKFLTKL